MFICPYRRKFNNGPSGSKVIKMTLGRFSASRGGSLGSTDPLRLQEACLILENFTNVNDIA
jgi:hypothetical protein